MLDEKTLQLVLNDKTFGKRESEKIVGGRARLMRLIGYGEIRVEKRPADRQNGRWYCNAWDVIKHARLSSRQPSVRCKR